MNLDAPKGCCFVTIAQLVLAMRHSEYTLEMVVEAPLALQGLVLRCFSIQPLKIAGVLIKRSLDAAFIAS